MSSSKDEAAPQLSEQAAASAGRSGAVRVNEPWTADGLAHVLPWPQEDDNKYTRGKLTLLAGTWDYPGAACLATKAAQRTGVGYALAVVPDRAVKRLVVSACPSAVAVEAAQFDFAGLGALREGRPQAACVGPGFSAADEWCKQTVLQALAEAACPVLVDGGGLAALATKRGKKTLAKRRERGACTVITPHGGEAARLASYYGVDAGNPAQLAAGLSEALGCIVVLKGPDTYIAEGLQVWPMTQGTSALAKAGTGDVLAGMIGSLLAQGLTPLDAARAGALLHALAGVEAARLYTSIGVTPEDVIEAIPLAIRAIGGAFGVK